ncbi:MAG: hypothetical protein P1Q69_11795 [Candidatus Thorarchaeota archaeon]|nr:hypothetical protein [Candidatus Thorarchaeota archaeon]
MSIGILEFPKQKRIIQIFFLMLLLSTIISWYSIRPNSYGASRTTLEAGEIEVFWFNGYTLYGESFRATYETEIHSVDVYFIRQGAYNLTSGTLSESYYYHPVTNITSFAIEGPIQPLYIIVVSEVDQWIYIQSWIYPLSAKISEIAAIPLTLILFLVSGYRLYSFKEKTEEEKKH